MLSVRVILFVATVAWAQEAVAERWVEYYRTGKGHSVEWDLNEVDRDSIERIDQQLQYWVRVRYADGKTSAPPRMQVDCVKRTRGQFPNPVMRDTYNGTLGREEVKAVCLTAAKEGK